MAKKRKPRPSQRGHCSQWITKERIFAKLKFLVEDATGEDLEMITTESRLVEDLVVDSLVNLDLIFKIEEGFQIKLPNGVSDQWKTVGDVVQTIQTHLRRKKRKNPKLEVL